MSIVCADLKLPWPGDEAGILKKLRKEFRIKDSEALQTEVLRRSMDARKKPDLFAVLRVKLILTPGREAELLKKYKALSPYQETHLHIPRAKRPLRPIIVGTGPAGLFAASVLTDGGVPVTVLERGDSMDDRIRSVTSFLQGGRLDPESNIQFGEGGAGTFSDGKLFTMVKDTKGLSRYMLETFVRFGAPKEILTDAHPHIGTDILRRVVKAMREDLQKRGAVFHFRTCFHEIVYENGRLKGVKSKDGRFFEGDTLILALGHSARDSFQMLNDEGFSLETKAFAVGFRVRHPQSMIQKANYGSLSEDLPRAEYKLTDSTGERAVYSFCMCPGGYIVNASSEEGRLAVNGMSYHARSGKYANSAIVCQVLPEDLPLYGVHEEGPLKGMVFQREIERRAYEAGGGKIPVQSFLSYASEEDSVEELVSEPDTGAEGQMKAADLRKILPERLRSAIVRSMKNFDKKIPGFSSEEAYFFGVESRTSSPIRIRRNAESMEAEGRKSVYPIGEGAGYAGGITSAAMDGIRLALRLLEEDTNES